MMPDEDEQSGRLSVTGDMNAIVHGTGDATVHHHVHVSAPIKQWLKPARQVMNKAFVGREELLATLIGDITAGKNVAITGKQATRALQGMGGIGKTYLALKLANDLYDHFPGHTLRIDVGPGVTDEESTQRPLSRLASYAFGGIAPPGPFQPEQVAAWLSETAPGPFLVVFDDLWHPTPLRLLSRALPAMAVLLVTTRFANVAQAIGATTIALARLTPEEGLLLLEERLHCQNDATHRAPLTALVRLLGGHALALEIVAGQIKKTSRLATVLHELEQGIGRGTLSGLNLAPGDERDENLERSFALSYEHLKPEQQSHFRALGVFAEDSLITAKAAAHIWGMDDLNTAQQALFELADLALLTEMETTAANVTTFRLHNLLRVYAHALLEKQDELTLVSGRHARFFTDLSLQAFTSLPQDNKVLDLYLSDLLAALHWSSSNNLSLFVCLFNFLRQFLWIRGQLVLLATYIPQALTVADHLGYKILFADILDSLGDLGSRLGKVNEAREHYNAALRLYHEEGAHLGEANVFVSLGSLESRLRKLNEARVHYDAALPLYRQEANHLGEANVLMSLGELESRLGNIVEARKHCNVALRLYREEGVRLGEANVLMSLGDLESRLGNIVEARNHYNVALRLYREEGVRLGEANVLMSLGDLEILSGEIDDAQRHYDAALPLYQREADRLGEASVFVGLGELESRLGNIDVARKHHDAALRLHRQEADRLGEATVHVILGELESRQGKLDEARKHYDAALLLYQQEEVRREEAGVHQRLGNVYMAQARWEDARLSYEKAQQLYVGERDPFGLANTLFNLGGVRFMLGEYVQGISDVQQAADLYRLGQNLDWAVLAEKRLEAMQAFLQGQEEAESD